MQTCTSHMQAEQSDLHLQEDGPVHPTPHLHVPERDLYTSLSKDLNVICQINIFC
jgi:hypothetical protein